MTRPSPDDLVAQILSAEGRINSFVQRTPLEESSALSSGRSAVYLKCENLQVTGSFKARGALAKLTSLDSSVRERGVVTASTGNHGAAVAYAAATTDTHAVVYIPATASPSKLELITSLGGEIRVFGTDGVEAERQARRVAEEADLTYVSPYNDPVVIAGQGTVGLEIAEQLPGIDAVLVAVGGGGLLSGVATYLKSINPKVRVIASSPANSAVLYHSLEAGRIIEMASLDTISDGTHGGVEADSITFSLCQRLIDDFVTVSEDEIVDAMVSFMNDHAMKIEGSAGVALAAYSKIASEIAGQVVAIVLCGSNISDEQLNKLVRAR